MLVRTISPAPSRSTSRAQATASSPVGTRPPLMWTSQTSRPSRSHPLGVDVDHDALAAEPPGRPAHELGVAHGRRVDRDLVGPRVQERPDVVQAADPAADRQRHEADLGRPPDHVPEDLPPLVAGGDVEEDQLVGPFRIIPRGDLDRIARVAEVEEVRPLDHAAMVDVEARDDPLGQHAQPHRGTTRQDLARHARILSVNRGYDPILERMALYSIKPGK